MHFQSGTLDYPKLRTTSKLFAITMLLVAFIVIITLAPQRGSAQTFSVLHKFSYGDGANPWAGVTLGGPGILYGTAHAGGAGQGLTYELKQVGSIWSIVPLYLFKSGTDGSSPKSPLVIASDGTFYGTTEYGGNSGLGTVFRLTPKPTICRTAFCYMNEQMIYSFSGNDGARPGGGAIVFDAAHNIYGTTAIGGILGQGIVFELTKSGSNWTESQSYSFTGQSDGGNPYGGVVLDPAGNIYGTTQVGGLNLACYNGFPYTCGTAFTIAVSSQTWSESVIHAFNGGSGGYFPFGTLIMDSQGTLYGTDFGAVYTLMQSDHTWSFSVIDNHCGNSYAGLTMDSAGDLFGVCSDPSFVYRLTYNNGHWDFQDLHDLSLDEGRYLLGTPVIDSDGNLFGTAQTGGNADARCETGTCGTVWEITGAAAPTRREQSPASY